VSREKSADNKPSVHHAAQHNTTQQQLVITMKRSFLFLASTLASLSNKPARAFPLIQHALISPRNYYSATTTTTTAALWMNHRPTDPSTPTTTKTTTNKKVPQQPISTTPSSSLSDFGLDKTSSLSLLFPEPLTKRVAALTFETSAFLDRVTNGWALSYANLAPETPFSPIGATFLWTNAAYLVAGICLTAIYQDYWLAFWTDVAAICSFHYHYAQLVACGKNLTEAQQQQISNQVRVALLLDYSAAGVSIVSALVYLLATAVTTHVLTNEMTQALVVGMAGVGFLGLSWKYEYGRPYMLWHSLWHLCSAYSGYLIGTSYVHGQELLLLGR
jgi:hypothetical protein